MSRTISPALNEVIEAASHFKRGPYDDGERPLGTSREQWGSMIDDWDATLGLLGDNFGEAVSQLPRTNNELHTVLGNPDDSNTPQRQYLLRTRLWTPRRTAGQLNAHSEVAATFGALSAKDGEADDIARRVARAGDAVGWLLDMEYDTTTSRASFREWAGRVASIAALHDLRRNEGTAFAGSELILPVGVEADDVKSSAANRMENLLGEYRRNDTHVDYPNFPHPLLNMFGQAPNKS